jgi:hypothetical protein
MQAFEATSEPVSTRKQPELGPFVAASLKQFEGRGELTDGALRIERYPGGWAAEDAVSRYALPGGPSRLPLLTLQTPIARSAINAMRELRYDIRSDPRTAARTHGDAEKPILVATFLTSVRTKDSSVEERVDALARTQDGSLVADPGRFLTAQRFPEPSNLADLAREHFGPWWEDAFAALQTEATEGAQRWSTDIAQERQRALARHRAALNDWYAAERNAVVHADDSAPVLLFAGSESPAVKRELARVEDERQRQLDELNARAAVEPASCEPIGILLVIPISK